MKIWDSVYTWYAILTILLYSGDLKSRLQMVGYGYYYDPNHLKTRPLEIRTFLLGFQMVLVLDKMATICPNFKWLGLWISDPIWNPHHLQPNLFLIIWNPDESGFQNPSDDKPNSILLLLSSARNQKYFKG